MRDSCTGRQHACQKQQRWFAASLHVSVYAACWLLGTLLSSMVLLLLVGSVIRAAPSWRCARLSACRTARCLERALCMQVLQLWRL